jgi:hypothetical protein
MLILEEKEGKPAMVYLIFDMLVDFRSLSIL